MIAAKSPNSGARQFFFLFLYFISRDTDNTRPAQNPSKRGARFRERYFRAKKAQTKSGARWKIERETTQRKPLELLKPRPIRTSPLSTSIWARRGKNTAGQGCHGCNTSAAAQFNVRSCIYVCVCVCVYVPRCCVVLCAPILPTSPSLRRITFTFRIITIPQIVWRLKAQTKSSAFSKRKKRKIKRNKRTEDTYNLLCYTSSTMTK